jgi:hypothetical protein
MTSGAVLADGGDDCCEGGNLKVMSEESSENCVSGLFVDCGFARAEANEQTNCALAAVSSGRSTHVVDTCRMKNKRKNHDLMTDCVMMNACGGDTTARLVFFSHGR